MPGHIFLSHAGVETDLAKELKQALQQAGLKVWLDVDELRTEQRGWGEAIEQAVGESIAFLVLVDRVPLRRWVTEEVRLALRRDVDLQARAEEEENAAKREGRTAHFMPGFALIPVLGPNATADALTGSFLGNRQAVQLPAARPWVDQASTIRARIESQDDGAAYQLPPDEPPFLGLQVFEPRHSLLFHGREQQVAELLDLLRHRDLIAVVGNSGSGKSSLVQAGLIPALYRGRFSPLGGHPVPWRHFVVRPGARPFQALVGSLVEERSRAGDNRATLADLELALEKLKSADNPIVSMLRAVSSEGEFVALVIDQLEELIQRADPSEARRFVECVLGALGDQQCRTVKVILTLRADYVANILELGFGAFAGHAQRGLLFTLLPDRTALQAAIEGPTYLTGRRFEPSLVQRILDDIGSGSGSLALLQFTLLQLWKNSGNATRIDHPAYQDIGGVSGALNAYADDVVRGLTPYDQNLVRRLFVALSDFDPRGRHTRRNAPRSEMLGREGEAKRRTELLDLLLQKRLIVDCDDPQASIGDPRYEVPHEELLRSWKVLADWIAADGEDARLVRTLEDQRRIWLAHGRDFRFGTMTLGQLEQVQTWSGRDPVGFNAELRQFVAACAAHYQTQADRERELGRRVAGAEDLRALQGLRAEAGNLWPPYPERIEALESWERRALALIDRLPDHRHALAELEGMAERSPLLEETYRELVAGLEQLGDRERGLLDGIDLGPDRQNETGEGLGIRRRLAFARTVADRTVTGAEAASRWNQLLADFRNRTPETFPAPYRDDLNRSLADLKPILGLIPWRKDPKSGLWELLHVFSGDFPETGPSGEFLQTPATGIILVLIPGGTFWMGAQKDDPKGQNYDPEAQPDEGPVHPVACPPFLIAKTTITQAQWTRMRGSNPSRYHPQNMARARVGETNPLETLSWVESRTWLPRFGLSLPSEARWEFAARAGTESPWWTGRSRESLQSRVNLADRTSAQRGLGVAEAALWPDFDDGFLVHAPAAEFVPNNFGLHQVHGNVLEWCEDLRRPYALAQAAHPDAMHGQFEPIRILRGGSFSRSAQVARSACRYGAHSDMRDADIGVRPAMLLP